MKKDLLDQSLSLTSRLRQQYFKTNDYLQKGKYRMKLKYFPGGKQHYDFDMNSQEYLLEQLDKVAFQSPEIQEHFLEQISQLLEEDLNSNQNATSLSQKIAEDCQVQTVSCPRAAREVLARHFHCRIAKLQHKRHLTLLRYHNHIKITEHSLKVLQNRLNLIDLEIQSCLTRKNRLKTQDLFEQSFGVSKPTAVNEDKQPIYRALEEEECRFSNIMRDDVEIYLRNQGHQENVLADYWSLHYQMKYMGLRNPLVLTDAVETRLLSFSTAYKHQAQEIVDGIFENMGFDSGKNHNPPDEVVTFFYRLYGVENAEPLVLPLHACMRAELMHSMPKAIKKCFQDLPITADNFSAVLPKLTNYVAILFKYQNKDIALEPIETKLGLDDEIDLKKELCALLEQTWVKRHVPLSYQIYDRYLQLTDSLWPKHTDLAATKPKSSAVVDYECQAIIGYLDINDYQLWRKHLKQISLKVIERAAGKFLDCYHCRLHEMTTKEQLNLHYLNELYHVGNKMHTEGPTGLRSEITEFLTEAVKNRLVTNPVEVETRASLFVIHTRQLRRKIRNLLNAGRCYYKRLAYDLRTFNLLPKQYEFDDAFILDSRKQDLDDFQRVLKESPTAKSNPLISGAKSSKKSLGLDRPLSAPTTKEIYRYDHISKQPSGEPGIPEPMVVAFESKKFILYDIVLKDLKEVESRLLQTASKFINSFEGYLKTKSITPLIDRHQLLSDLYECQLLYQREKFELLEVLMLIYSNTVEPGDCSKLCDYVFEVMARVPVVDYQEPYFKHSYQVATETLAKERTVLFRSWQQLVNREILEVNAFHKRLSRTIRVPYHRYGVLYGDLDVGPKMNRTNSLASLKSSRSGSQHGSGGKSPVRLHKKSSEIIEVDEDVDFSDMESESGLQEIENYDEYLLTRDLDQIFDQIARDDPALQPKQNQQNNVLKEQVSAQNNVVHRRFEGGPHFLGKDREVTLPTYSDHRVEFFNFFEFGHWVINFPALLKENQQDLYERYGFCSHLYQAQLMNCLMEEGVRIIAQPDPQPKCTRRQYHWDDNYLLVMRNLTFYKQLMKENLDPPPLSAMALHHTLPKHIESIPAFAQLQHLDIHQLECLLELKKPSNIISYRQLMLALNLLDVFRFDQMIRHAALQRKQLSKAYKMLGKELGVEIKKYGAEYQRVTDSAFLTVQELKISGTSDLFGFGMKSLPQSILFPDSISELKVYVFCEKANVANFETFVRLQRRKYTTLLRLQHQLNFALKHKAFYRNNRLDRTKIDVFDDSNTKALNNRLRSLLGTKAMAFRESTYLRSKVNFKAMFQRKHLETTTVIYGDKPIEQKPIKLINQKKSKLTLIKLVELYGRDLMRAAQQRSVTLELLAYTRVLKRQVRALPFPAQLFSYPEYHHYLQDKFYFDQKNRRTDTPPFLKVFDAVTGKLSNPFYIYNQEQIFEQALPAQFVTELEQYQPEKFAQVVNQSRPPSNKQQLVKWFFHQSEKGFAGYQSKSFRYLQKLNRPFVGGCNKYEESCYRLPLEARTNSFLALLDHYRRLEQYLQSQLIVMSFSGIDANLIQQLLSEHRSFDETYSLASMQKVQHHHTANQAEQVHSREKQLYERLDQNAIKTLYIYEDRPADILQQTKKTIQNAHKQHEHNKEVGNFDKQFIRAHNSIAVDQAAEFLVQRVQGLGLVREAFLPFSEEIRLLGSTMAASGDNRVLSLRSQNIHRWLYISVYELYRSWPGGEGSLIRLYNHWFYPHRVGTRKLEQARCYPLNQSPLITSDESEKYVYTKRMEKFKKDLMFRLRCSLLNLPVDMNSFLAGLVKSASEQPVQYAVTKHFSSTGTQRLEEFVRQGLEMVGDWKEADRLKMLARLKFTNQSLLEFLELKNVKPQEVLKSQELKLEYLKLLVKSNMYTTTLVYFQKQVFLPLPTYEYSEYYFELQNYIQSKALTVLTNFQHYSDKLQITRAERQLMHSPLTLQDRQNSAEKQYHNRLIRQIICLKLLREELKCRLLRTNIDILNTERLPQNEPKRNVIVNPGLIPRVKLNSCYSSPLVVDRKNYISQQYKLSFVQAFINRLRNKVSRVDLLSSGYGFVITVSDLEDCVNFLNKSLFTFTEKQFKYRLDTFGQYCEMLVDAVQYKNAEIVRLDGLLQATRMQLRNVNQTVYIEKVNNLLAQNQLLKQKVQTVQENSKGLEDRVRKAVNLEYQARVSELSTENDLLKKRFREFQSLLTTLTKSEARSSFLELVNELRVKSSDLLERTLDFGVLIPKHEYKQEQHQSKRAKQHTYYDSNVERGVSQEDIQKCKIGEDIIHDPYYVTKLINKMRGFNVLKLAAFKSREQLTNQRLKKELGVLSNIHDATVMQTRKELVLREELTRVQQDLASRMLELESYKQRCDGLQGENEKLRIELLNKQKKLQQRINNPDTSFLPQINKPRDDSTGREAGQNRTDPKRSTFNESYMKLKVRERAKIRMLQASQLRMMAQTEPLLVPDEGTLQLSNKELSWQEKCQQLYSQNRGLQRHLEQLKQQLQAYRIGKTIEYQQILDPRPKPKSVLSQTQKGRSSEVSTDRRRRLNVSYKYKAVSRDSSNN